MSVVLALGGISSVVHVSASSVRGLWVKSIC
jgi:hypothetical protein